MHPKRIMAQLPHVPRQDRRRSRTAEIVDSVIRAVGQFGIRGATVSRIAAGVGLTEMALYRYFDSRDDMLRAAYAHLTGRALSLIAESGNPYVPDRLREHAEAHLTRLVSDLDMYTLPVMQFASRPAQDHLLAAEEIAFRNQQVDAFRAHLEEGIAKGQVRKDLDCRTFAWEMIAWAQGEMVHYLIAARTGIFDREPHARTIELLVRDIEIRKAPNKAGRRCVSQPKS